MGSTIYLYKSFELCQSICTRKFLPGRGCQQEDDNQLENFATSHRGFKDTKSHIRYDGRIGLLLLKESPGIPHLLSPSG